MHRQDEFIELILSDANMMGSIYGKIDEELLHTGDQAERIAVALSYV
jgi:hypothetical protein